MVWREVCIPMLEKPTSWIQQLSPSPRQNVRCRRLSRWFLSQKGARKVDLIRVRAIWLRGRLGIRYTMTKLEFLLDFALLHQWRWKWSHECKAPKKISCQSLHMSLVDKRLHWLIKSETVLFCSKKSRWRAIQRAVAPKSFSGSFKGRYYDVLVSGIDEEENVCRKCLIKFPFFWKGVRICTNCIKKPGKCHFRVFQE